MNWYKGSIAEAVNLCKQKNAIFVVYVEGNDPYSLKLRSFVNEQKIKEKLESEQFVAIRIQSGSESYMQFAQIYQLVPLPSLFFIGQTGIPLEIVTAAILSADELEEKIENVLKSTANSASSSNAAGAASANFISGEQTASSSTSTPSTSSADKNSEVVCDNGVCYKKPTTDSINQVEQPSPNETEKTEKQIPKQSEEDDTKAKVEQAQKLLEAKRKEKEQEDARLERGKELNRRKEGKDMQSLKEWQKEQELKEFKENIRREKLEEQAARQKILEKIASDKAERAHKFGQPAASPPVAPKKEQTIPKPPVSHENSEFSRIQFRTPDGEQQNFTFNSSDKFEVVREYVRNTILQGTRHKEFFLATTFPRKEFTDSDDSLTLFELGLCPSAVILVITKPGSGPAAVVARSGGFINIFNTVFWAMLSPIFSVFSFVKRFITGEKRDDSSNSNSGAQKRASENQPSHQDAAKKRNLDRLIKGGLINDGASTSTSTSSSNENSVPYRRVGGSNIHRLADHKDSDDENNTWNGNSTQQQ